MAQPIFSCIFLLELALCAGFLRGMGVLQPATLIGLMGSSVTLNCTCQCQGRSVHGSLSRWDVQHNNTSEELWRGGHGMQILEAALQEETRYDGHHVNHTSSLVITSLQISDAGNYVCTIITIIPPPVLKEKGHGTVLRVVAPPHVWLSLSPVGESPLSVVQCAVSEFYPDSIDVTLASTCGGSQDLDDNTHPIKNLDETYSTTRRARLNTTGCANGTEVTCTAKHETGERSKYLTVSGAKNKGKTQGISPKFFIKTGVFAVFVSIICAIFLAYNLCCGHPKEESIGCMRSKPEASLDAGFAVQEN